MQDLAVIPRFEIIRHMCVPGFEIAVSSMEPALLVARTVIVESESPYMLRGLRGQQRYLDHVRDGGNGIREGWQRNLFPYREVTSMLEFLTGVTWGHYIYADCTPLTLALMIDLMGRLKAPSWIAFINPTALQSQRHLPHGHALVPVETMQEVIQ